MQIQPNKNEFLPEALLPYPHHLTASAIVIHKDHVLLVDHKRIGAWVPPGGHVEARESPDFAVKRELEEETGLMVELISDAQPPSLDAEAVFLSRPYYVQLVKATESGKDFFHLDLAYLCRPVPDSFEKDQNGMPRLSINNELKAATWVPLCDLSQLNLAKNVQAALEMIRTSIQDILHLF